MHESLGALHLLFGWLFVCDGVAAHVFATPLDAGHVPQVWLIDLLGRAAIAVERDVQASERRTWSVGESALRIAGLVLQHERGGGGTKRHCGVHRHKKKLIYSRLSVSMKEA